jgi:hypothetical protein
MKRSIIIGLLCATVAIPTQSDGWVAVGGRGWGGAAWGGGCWHAGWGCGGVSTGTAVAAGLAGFAAGAAVGAATRPAVVVAPAPVVVAPTVIQIPPAIGAIYYSLPYGAQSTIIQGQQYYVLGSTFYRPYFGGNGVYYEVVPYPN